MYQLCLRTQTMPFCICCRRRKKKEHTQVQVQKKKERKEHIQQVKKETKEHTQVKKKERNEHTQVQKKERKKMKMKVVELNNYSSLSPKQQQKKKHKPINVINNNGNINSNNNNKSSYSSSVAAKERIEEESKRIREKSLRNRQAKIQSLLLAGVGDSITGVSSRKKSLNESYDKWNKQGTSFIVDNSKKNLKAKNSTTNVITSPTTMKKKRMKLKKENLAVMTTTINERQFEVGDRVMKKVKNKITDQIITHGPYIIINYLASIDGDHTEDKVIIQNNKSFTPVYETISVTKVVPYKEY